MQGAFSAVRNSLHLIHFSIVFSSPGHEIKSLLLRLAYDTMYFSTVNKEDILLLQ